jgi:aminoglycoside phosphotransferase
LLPQVQAWLETELLPRCRPGQRFARPLQLVRDRGTGDGERVDWVSATLAPSGETLEVVLTFGAADALAGVAAGGGADVAWSAELGCLAEVFPRDHALPDLVEAVRPEWALELTRDQHCFSRAPGTHVEVGLVRYRPHSRAVLLYRERDAAGGVTGEAIAKVFRSPGKAERAWRLMRRVIEHSEHTEPTEPNAGASIVPRAIALRNSVVVMEKVPGTDLEALLEQPGEPRVLDAVRAAARTLRSFHAVPPGEVKRTKPSKHMHTIAGLARSLPARSDHHDIERDIARIVGALERRTLEAPGPVEAVLVHGSFKPSAVLVGDGRATIVDLDYAGLGDRIDDLAHFTGHVRRLAVARADARLDGLADAFLAAYGPLAGGAAPARRVRALEAVLLALSGLHAVVGAASDEVIEQGLLLLRAAERLLG